MADTGTPIHVRISGVPEKNITHKPPAADPRPLPTGRMLSGLEHLRPAGAAPFSRPSRSEPAQLSGASPPIAGARSSAAAVRNPPLLCREAVPFSGASQPEARARFSAAAVLNPLLLCRGAALFSAANPAIARARFSGASLPKARARSRAAAVVGRAETAVAAVVHREEDKFTGLNSGGSLEIHVALSSYRRKVNIPFRERLSTSYLRVNIIL